MWFSNTTNKKQWCSFFLRISRSSCSRRNRMFQKKNHIGTALNSIRCWHVAMSSTTTDHSPTTTSTSTCYVLERKEEAGGVKVCSCIMDKPISAEQKWTKMITFWMRHAKHATNASLLDFMSGGFIDTNSIAIADRLLGHRTLDQHRTSSTSPSLISMSLICHFI